MALTAFPIGYHSALAQAQLAGTLDAANLAQDGKFVTGKLKSATARITLPAGVDHTAHECIVVRLPANALIHHCLISVARATSGSGTDTYTGRILLFPGDELSTGGISLGTFSPTSGNLLTPDPPQMEVLNPEFGGNVVTTQPSWIMLQMLITSIKNGEAHFNLTIPYSTIS